MAVTNLEMLEQSIGLEPGKLQEMITSEEEHSLTLDNYVITTKDDLMTKEENIKREAKQAGLEIAIKKARNDLGLDFEGKKTLEPLLEAYAKKIEAEAKKDPNEKYDSLKSDFEKLQGMNAEWEQKYMNLENTYKQREQTRTINEKLLNAISDNTTIPKEDILAIAKARTDFKVGENGIEIIKDGQVLKNEQNLNPLTVDEYMKDFVKPYLKPVEGGAGGKDSRSGANETSFEMFEKRMEEKGINVGSSEYNAEMSKAISNGTLKL
jgi:hypothetical protein